MAPMIKEEGRYVSLLSPLPSPSPLPPLPSPLFPLTHPLSLSLAAKPAALSSLRSSLAAMIAGKRPLDDAQAAESDHTLRADQRAKAKRKADDALVSSSPSKRIKSSDSPASDALVDRAGNKYVPFPEKVSPSCIRPSSRYR